MSVFLLFFLHALRSGCVRACPWAGQATAVQCPARWSNRLAPSMLRCRPSNLWCGTCAVPSSFHSSSEPTPAETGICATTPRGCVMCRERQASVRAVWGQLFLYRCWQLFGLGRAKPKPGQRQQTNRDA